MALQKSGGWIFSVHDFILQPDRFLMNKIEQLFHKSFVQSMFEPLRNPFSQH
jgi:hypothetical protein